MPEQFISVALEDVLVGEPLPTTIYLYLDYRFIAFRGEGDSVDRSAYERLELKRIHNLFIREKERSAWDGWVKGRQKEIKAMPGLRAPEAKPIQKVREDLHRKTMDIFLGQHPDKAIQQTLTVSRKLVTEVMKAPFAIRSLTQLQTYSQGTVDHSVNVSVLSVYLAMQMGYSHALILQHVGMGGLLHDVGKTKVPIAESDSDRDIELKMRDHPTLGVRMLEGMPKVPNEVKLIVGQHHETQDGAGFPKKLRGAAIYDLARIVSIANVFDELVGDGKGTLVERQRSAIQQLDRVLYKKFDPQKLEKSLKILKMGV